MTTMTEHQKLPDSLEERYQRVRERVADCAVRTGRKPGDVMIVAVTKTADPDQIRALIELGHRDFGENRVQQLVQRAAMVDEYLQRLRLMPSARARPAEPAAEPEVRWHMIGHLQRNKARKVVDIVRLVHSVDSLRIAEELQQVAIRRERVVEVLLQVNCTGEEAKFGCPVPAAIPLAEQIESMVNLRLRGLMTMAEENAGEPAVRSCFGRCRYLFDEMRSQGLGDGRFDLLSMGMSGDYEHAIAEGANLVRIGGAIFGRQSAEPAPEPDADADAEAGDD